MADDIIDRLQCSYRKGEWPCEECTFCAARAEIERLRAERDDWQSEYLTAFLQLGFAVDEIANLRAAGDALTEQITKPCRCVEAHDGAINETCAPCAACFDWQEARRG